MPPFVIHIRNVVKLGSHPQVIRTNTRRVIASVKNLFFPRSVVEQPANLVCRHSSSACSASAFADIPVAVPILPAGPEPATFGLNHFEAKAPRERCGQSVSREKCGVSELWVKPPFNKIQRFGLLSEASNNNFWVQGFTSLLAVTIRGRLLSFYLFLLGSSIALGQGVAPAPWYGGCHPKAVDWALRCVTNGAAFPSQGSVITIGNFYTVIQSQGIVPLFKCLNCVAPDSDIAARTPLIIGNGLALWTGGGGAGNSINGYTASGTALNTGVNPSTVFSTSSAGWSAYFWLANPNGTLADNGNAAVGCRVTAANAYFMTNPRSAGLWYSWCFDNSATVSVLGIAGASPQPGFYTLDRTSTTAMTIYHGAATYNSGILGAYVSRTGTATVNPPNANFYFCGENLDGVNTVDTRPLSFMALHDGMTQNQASSFYLAVDGLRKGGGSTGIVPGFGGGYD